MVRITNRHVRWVAVLALLGVGEDVIAQESAGAPPVLHFPGDQVHLALLTETGRPLVNVSIGAAGPFRFILDTGSGISLIDVGIATRLGLKVTGTQSIGAPGGETVDVERVAVPVLTVGDLTIGQTEMVAFGIAEMSGGLMDGTTRLRQSTDHVHGSVAGNRKHRRRAGPGFGHHHRSTPSTAGDPPFGGTGCCSGSASASPVGGQVSRWG